jgi:protein-L-isoaspartate(D-aspartate) O-methyltransferase
MMRAMAAAGESRALRRELVDKLRLDGQIRSRAVAEAFLAVPREVFVPGVALDDVYRSSEAILVKRVDGVGVSSASAPDVMATMLELLDVRPGMRVLEIGAGTGYNAALLGFLVGDGGAVVSVDIDADLVDGARAHLTALGCNNVDVVLGDGALGYATDAPYDRIMLTVASRDLAPAWREQLTADGRLLLPLALRGPQRCVVFASAGDHLVSRGLCACGFIPLRGALAMETLRVPLDPDGAITIGLPDDRASISTYHVRGLLEAATGTWPTGIDATPEHIRHGLHLWLAAHDAAICSLWSETTIRGVPDLFGQAERYRGTLGLLDHEALALLAWRDEHLHHGELVVCAATEGEPTASRLVRHIQAWGHNGRPQDDALAIRAFGRDVAFVPAPGEVILRQRWTTFLLSWDGQPPAIFTV